MPRETSLELSIDGLRQELQLHAPRGLSIDRVRQPSRPHLLEHSPYTLAQLLPKAEIGTYTRNARVTGKAHGLQRIVEIHQARESSWTRDLNAIVEDLHPDVVPGHAVGAVDGGGDYSLEPCIVWHQRKIFEAAHCHQ